MTTRNKTNHTGLTQAVETHLKTHRERVSRLEHAGAFYWVKQEEKLTLRMRLQKGNAHKSFEAERHALHQLHDLHAPVPEILAEGESWFVLPDSGADLQGLLHNPSCTKEEKRTAFTMAGEALADLHAKGVSHGRPVLRDFCWRAPKITLLDFERFTPTTAPRKGQIRDLIIFAHSALTTARGFTPELGAALAAYRAQNTSDIWQGAVDYTARLRWLDWLTKPIQMRHEGKAKEFKAIPMVIDLFADRKTIRAPDHRFTG